MYLNHYFDPVDFQVINKKLQLSSKYILGHYIENYTNKVVAGKIYKTNIAILGVPYINGIWDKEEVLSIEKIRLELYQLASLEDKINIIDFGNLKKTKNKKESHLAIRDVIDYLNELNITSIIIGGSQDISYGVCKCFNNEPFFTLSVIDALLDVKKGIEQFNSTNYLTRIFNSNLNLFQFSLLGYQGHLISNELFAKTKGINEHLRLGVLRHDIKIAEPIIRNSDFLSFDFGAIKYSEAPGSANVLPNGLRSEEACQLAKYAGLSNRLKVLALCEANAKADKSGLTAKLSAQIIWYFLSGFIHRDGINPETDENKIIYKVEVKNVDYPLVFYRNPETQQWWMEVQSLKGKKTIIACSKKEYKSASKNEIPKLWLKYVQKIDELSK